MALKNSILQTLIYHDIFNYPLTKNELFTYLINTKTTQKKLEKELESLVKGKKISYDQKYYCLNKSIKFIQLRKKRYNHSVKKFKKALLYSSILQLIPTIKMVAVSGSLAMENSKNSDDIDLVIVSYKNTLWTTRFLANLILFPFKRDLKGNNIINRACINLLIDESALKLKEKNIYIAHELYQMKPIWQRQNAYNKFIKLNHWASNYLPNWQPLIVKSIFKLSFIANQFKIFESFLMHWQFLYMKSKITSEKVSAKQIFLHPSGIQSEIIIKFNSLKNKYLKID